MANAETTFSDRRQRGVDMQTAVAGFSPAFTPLDPSLAAAAFLTFLEMLDILNIEVGTLTGQYTIGVQQRMPMMLDIQDRALRVLSLVKSNPAWKAFLPTVKSYVDKIRGNTPRPPKAPAPGETPGSPPAADLTIANLTTLASGFATKNLTMSRSATRWA